MNRTMGAQCKLTALGGGATCKFLGKWWGGATVKLTSRFKYKRYFTKSCTHYFRNMNRTWLTVYHIKNKMEHTVIVK